MNTPCHPCHLATIIFVARVAQLVISVDQKYNVTLFWLFSDFASSWCQPRFKR